MAKAYAAYIMSSASGTLYVGMTSDIFVRALQHKHGEFEGFSKKYSCNRLVYYEEFDSVFRAIAREKQRKGWRRSKKVGLIESRNPRWEDLAEHWGSEVLYAPESIGRKSGA